MLADCEFSAFTGNRQLDMEMRSQNSIIAAGVMSGTSLDGMDMVLATFERVDKKWRYEILRAKGTTYPRELIKKMRGARKMSAQQLMHLEHELSLYWADHLRVFLDEAEETVDLVSIHGQTIFHQPEKKLTLQIADIGLIAAHLGKPVIGDFRRADVALGGQGAPLVPIGDRLLFSEQAACLNLGGFSNLSFVKNGVQVAMDLSAANHLLNRLAGEIGMEFDMDGALASVGVCHESVLEGLADLDYFKQSGPKSLGYEWFDEHFFPLWVGLTKGMDLEDRMRTACAHIAQQVGANLQGISGEILITGGGAFNKVLMDEISAALPATLSVYELTEREQCLIAFKEALVFAFLGVLRWRGENNVLSEITGASRDHCAGIVAFP